MILPYVYKHTNSITNEYYFGSRIANKIESNLDLSIYICSAKQIKHSIQKSRLSWHSQVIAHFFTAEDAYWFEQSLIKANWGCPLLLNKQYQDKELGHGMFMSKKTFSIEHKLKISNSLKSYQKSEKHRKALSNSLQGRTLNPESISKGIETRKLNGYTVSKETCKKISESLKGHPVSAQTREKISNANKGRSRLKGKENPFSKPIMCIETSQIFESQNAAANALGLKQGDINNVLNNRQKSTKGYSFVFV